MALAQVLRDDDIERLADRLAGLEAEDACGAGVPEADDAAGVSIDDGIGGVLHEIAAEAVDIEIAGVVHAARRPNASDMVAPTRCAFGAMTAPASRNAAILPSTSSGAWAVSAPAWPMRRSGGAARPTTSATTGFLRPVSRMKRAASCSSLPPISPISTTPWVSGSSKNRLTHSAKPMPWTRSPPMPIVVDWPRPAALSWATTSLVSDAERETTPIGPRRARSVAMT